MFESVSLLILQVFSPQIALLNSLANVFHKTPKRDRTVSHQLKSAKTAFLAELTMHSTFTILQKKHFIGGWSELLI